MQSSSKSMGLKSIDFLRWGSSSKIFQHFCKFSLCRSVSESLSGRRERDMDWCLFLLKKYIIIISDVRLINLDIASCAKCMLLRNKHKTSKHASSESPVCGGSINLDNQMFEYSKSQGTKRRRAGL